MHWTNWTASRNFLGGGGVDVRDRTFRRCYTISMYRWIPSKPRHDITAVFGASTFNMHWAPLACMWMVQHEHCCFDLPNFKPGNGKFPCWSTSWSLSIISYHKMNKNPSRHVLAGKSSSVISNHRWKVIFHWNIEGFRRFLKDPGLGHGFLRTCLRLFCHGATRQGLKTWGPYDVLYVVVNLRALLSGPIYIQCLYRIWGGGPKFPAFSMERLWNSNF